ncbi:MAG TPA: methionyl-tRNA formyltransferase [Burkholderiales bacterium]
MNLIFAGTPSFAARILDALLDSRHRVIAVLTQPDRPAGRGLGATASEVKKRALDRGIAVLQPASLHDTASSPELVALRPDIMVVAAYGLILPERVLGIPRLGCINVHASLLPRWRGAAPIQRALLAGDTRTGISIMQMDPGLDTGPVLLQEACAIGDEDTAGTLHDRLATLGAVMCARALDGLQAGALVGSAQSQAEATYAPKIRKEEARIDWRDSAISVRRRVRAFDPTPGATAVLRGMELKLWSCALGAGDGAPGEVLNASTAGLLVACGEGAVLVTELQRPGGRRLQAGDFLRGCPVSAGERFSVGSAG